MENFTEIINSRRSVRNFTQQPVEKELINKILDFAIKAPSACNIQGWHFIVVDDEEIKQKLIDFGGSIVIGNAPVGILVLYDGRTKNTEFRDNIQSAAAAIENILLAATHYDLGSCWICHLPSKRQLRKIFSIPEHMDPIAYVLLGYKKFISVEVPRKYKSEEITSFNKYLRDESKNAVKVDKYIFIQRLLMKIYYLTPLFIKKYFLNRFMDKKFVKKFKN